MNRQTAQPPHASSKTVTMVLRECAICQSPIYPAETITTCPKCGLNFHAECWNENMGCAAYGCEQVNALAPKAAEPEPEPLPLASDQPAERLPWDFVLLGFSALAFLVSALTFGVPSAVACVCVGMRAWKKIRRSPQQFWLDARQLLREPRKLLAAPAVVAREPILLTAGVLAAAGVVLGAAVSTFWYLRDYTPGG